MIDFILAFLIEQTGSEKYRTRVQAREILRIVVQVSGRLGPVEKGAKSRDAEIRRTCRRILAPIYARRDTVDIPEGLNLCYFDNTQYPSIHAASGREKGGPRRPALPWRAV